MNKKCLGAVVATALLIVVSVLAVIGFQTWFQTYSSSILVNVENNEILNVNFEKEVGNTLYLKSNKVTSFDYLSVSSMNGTKVCEISKDTIINFNSSTVLLLDMDHKNSTHIFDLSGYINNGNYNNLNCMSNGIYGKSCYFNGNGETYINVSNLSNENFPQLKGTISFWLKYKFKPVNANSAFIFDRYRHDNNHIFIRGINNSKGNIQIGSQNLSLTHYAAHSIVNAQISEWTLITMVFNNIDRKILYYINGNLVEEDSGDTFPDNNWYPDKQNVIFGSELPTYKSFDGYLDEITIYNTTLTSEQVSYLYSKKKAIKYEQLITKGISSIDLSSCNLNKNQQYNLIILGDHINIQQIFIVK